MGRLINFVFYSMVGMADRMHLFFAGSYARCLEKFQMAIISRTDHPIHSIFGSSWVRFSGSAD